ncbi:transposase, MuDR [Tanacetum coccineum]|uniref:Transposase, MuDR n=1 Tax=Tanacetum coccineum TaxID=301880 RepID=A0ABQ5AXK6_9ASTR
MLAATWSLRPDGHSLDSYNEYRNHPTTFTLKINHGGTLTSPPNVRYRGGKANWFDDVDVDTFSAIEVQTMVKDLGYVHKDLQLYYKIPKCNLDIGLKPLSCDKDVMEMCQYVSQCKVMDVFVIHPISEPELVSNEDIDNEFDPLFSYPDNNTYKDRPSGSNAGKSPSGSNAGKRPSVIEDVDGSDSSAASEDSEDSDDSEFDVGDEDRIEDVEVDMDDFRKHTDENVEWVECNEEEVQVPPPFDYEEVDLEDFGSGTESDDLECERKRALKKLAKAHRPVDGQMYTENFYVGQSLANKQLIKEMVSKLSVAQRRQLWFTRNDKTRMRAECRGLVPVFGNGPGDSGLGVGDGGPDIPILAYAVVESETKESWLWFLDCLGDDLELFKNSNFTFISDRQKLHGWGEQYKTLLWRCATATTVQRFGKNMEEIKKFDLEMYKWLKDVPPQHWARSHFSGRPHCDVLLNNMCEVLNRQILNGRDKPIITCLEFIREYLMKRIVIVQGIIGKSTGPLTPNATKIFNVIKRDAAQYKEMGNHWHALQACSCLHLGYGKNGLEPGILESLVHESYWLKTWKEMYMFKINPCNGPDMWPESDTPITLTPPNYKPLVGRPRKKRRKSATEIYDNLVKKGKLSRAGKTVTCLKCGQQGHNKRSCKGQRQKGSASGSHAPPQAPSQTTTHASAQALQSSTQPSQAPQSSTQPSQASQSSNRFTKSTTNRLSPLKKKFVGPRPAATQKNGVPKPTAATKKKDVSKAKGKQKKN